MPASVAPCAGKGLDFNALGNDVSGEVSGQHGRLQGADGREDATEVVREALAGGADARGEEFRQVKREPAVERCRDAAGDKDRGEQLGPIGVIRQIQIDERGERPDAKNHIGGPSADRPAGERGENRTDDSAERRSDLRVLLRMVRTAVDRE